jgi:hypothetical protein
LCPPPQHHLASLLDEDLVSVRNAILPRKEAVRRVNAVLAHFGETGLRSAAAKEHLFRVFERASRQVGASD